MRKRRPITTLHPAGHAPYLTKHLHRVESAACNDLFFLPRLSGDFSLHCDPRRNVLSRISANPSSDKSEIGARIPDLGVVLVRLVSYFARAFPKLALCVIGDGGWMVLWLGISPGRQPDGVSADSCHGGHCLAHVFHQVIKRMEWRRDGRHSRPYCLAMTRLLILA